MLLGNADRGLTAVNALAYSPIGMLHRELELEYLASRLFFFQGLINWLGAIGLNLSIPLQVDDSKGGTRHLRQCGSCGMFATILLMLAFYDKHLNFYGNYFAMWCRLMAMFAQKYLMAWPPSWLALAAVAFLVKSGGHALKAFHVLE
eukprot:gb/GFBE01001680.1/.p1 GENE.gb/GFBE01001680.1/~~gb/GFBE01001680.1/.p1  ORF type:complete len:147 (+),score=33.54 gb/GFBE01001680.1/:1-441(+)